MFRKVVNLVKGKKQEEELEKKKTQFMESKSHADLRQVARLTEERKSDPVVAETTESFAPESMSLFKNALNADKVDETELEQQWLSTKTQKMEELLGKEHEYITAALIPFEIGGTLDLHYYPHDIEGTGIATQELTFACKKSPTNDWFRKFELVMFTRETLELAHVEHDETPFGKVHSHYRSILNPLARHALQSKLNPYEIVQLPEGIAGRKKTYLICVPYKFSEHGIADFGLLAIMEIFYSEMEYAKRRGGESLIRLLEERAYYPYADMDRHPVI